MDRKDLEAPPGFEPGMEVLQTSALPLGDGALREDSQRDTSCPPAPDRISGYVSVQGVRGANAPGSPTRREPRARRHANGVGRLGSPRVSVQGVRVANAPGSENGAGNGIRTRDFNLGKVALYH